MFWDTRMEDIDVDEHARFVIHRVITKGDMSDWYRIKAYYGMTFMEKEILEMRHLDAKTLNLFCMLFKRKKEDFRCYTWKQSTQIHYPY